MKKLILLFVVIISFSCKNETAIPENFDYGTIEDGVYTNDYFKMRFPFDASWDIQSKEEMKEIADSGTEMLTDEKTKRAVKATEINSANLFSAFKYETGFEEGYNYSILIVAENTKMFPQVKRGSDYLKEAKKMMTQTVINYEFDNDFETKAIGGKSFDVMNVTGDYLGGFFKQKYMTTIVNGFSFSIIISYDSNEQLQELEALIDGIIFYDSQSKKKAA
ncbi:hypothetical protein [Psychroserpens sp. Hel_I_66]|uniref:hypothetical protein n=1 Tax=Psychroserpens sp. Hel_I_66 TaxID=1250004 RepID=UPI000647B99A|nr:hypothetical protein [Psychroserpens sp. Hel_I_66]